MDEENPGNDSLLRTMGNGTGADGKTQRLPDAGWKEALELYKAQADDLDTGRAYEVDLIERPVKFVPNFKRSDAKTMRNHRATRRETFFLASDR